jgi:hypothetical protein
LQSEQQTVSLGHFQEGNQPVQNKRLRRQTIGYSGPKTPVTQVSFEWRVDSFGLPVALRVISYRGF